MAKPETTKPDGESISISIEDCEVSFREPTKNGKIAINGKKSEFLFEFHEAVSLTDSLHSKQYHDPSLNQKITEIYIKRKSLGKSIFGQEEILIPLIKIVSK